MWPDILLSSEHVKKRNELINDFLISKGFKVSRNIGTSLLVNILGSTLFIGADINLVFALWKHLNSSEIRVIDRLFLQKAVNFRNN